MRSLLLALLLALLGCKKVSLRPLFPQGAD